MEEQYSSFILHPSSFILSPVDGLYLLAALLLLLLAGIFTAAETGMLLVNRFRVHQLAEEGSPRALLLRQLLQQSPLLLTALLILITGLNYLNGVLVTAWLHNRHHWPAWLPWLGLLIVVLIFAAVTPIRYATENPELVALRGAPWTAWVMTALAPLLTAVKDFSSGLLRLCGIEAREKPPLTAEEARTIIDLGLERGGLEEEEKELINSIFEFSDTIVREIMVPRIDIFACSDEQTIADAIALFADAHVSRLPVYQGSLDHVIGQVNAKDLLPYQFSRQTTIPVREAMRPVTLVPETKRVSELLHEFRDTKQTLAIVLDEYGGTAGLVTIEDLLEEIFGEIYDEYDVEESASIEWLDERTVVVDGKLALDEIEDLLHHELPHGDYDTLSGLLYARFGDVPARGECLAIDGFDFSVERLDGHRITKVRIVKN